MEWQFYLILPLALWGLWRFRPRIRFLLIACGLGVATLVHCADRVCARSSILFITDTRMGDVGGRFGVSGPGPHQLAC